ncbi:MAG: HipA domain-containing protein [Acidobacteriia bacterium]|nr:HipA domain-containing protein [Terriglobia bacterium]
MAQTLYGNVYYQTAYAGVLREEPDGRYTFTYHPDYLEAGNPAIAFTLPLQLARIYSRGGLHSFFDNLVSEGWLANAQARALGIQTNDRFGRLLAFGHDCIGAVSVLDPRPRSQPDLQAGSPDEIAALASRASISGVQPKLMAVKTDGGYRPARSSEPSTHVAKLPSGHLQGIVDLEYLTTTAAAQLLSDDRLVDLEIARVDGVRAPCLLVRRFDRSAGVAKIHFEEFNQLLDRPAEAKYEGSYAEMAAFIRTHPRCETADIDFLFRRVLACILLGNNDAHMKNFGLLYEGSAMRLSPAYDLVAGALYPGLDSQLALRIGEGPNPRSLGALGPKHIQALAKSFGIGRGSLLQAVHDLEVRLDAALEAVNQAQFGKASQKKQLIEFMRKRWNGTFKSIGRK